MNFRICGRDNEIIKGWTPLRTDNNGYVNLSDLNFTFFPNYNQPFIIEYKFDGEDYKYYNSSSQKSIFVTKFDSHLSINIGDVVSVGDKLSGVVRLFNKSSGLGVVGADLNVSLKALKGGLSYSKVLSTNSDGGIDLSDLDYNFTVDGKYNLSVTYNGDNYYESSNISKMFAVYPLPVPFNGTFHSDNPDGYYNVHVNNSRGSVLDDSVVLYNMSEALNGYVIKGNLYTRNAEANIVNNILTIKWNVPAGKFGYVTIFVKKS